MQINEPLGAQKPIQFHAASGMPSHEPLERGRLVWREVVDVHAWVGLPPLHEEVHELFKGQTLRVARKAPEGSILRLSGFDQDEPEEVF